MINAQASLYRSDNGTAYALVKATVHCAFCDTVDTWEVNRADELAKIIEAFQIRHFHCNKQKGLAWPQR